MTFSYLRARWSWPRRHAARLVPGVMVLVTGCALIPALGRRRDDMRSLAGIWIDSARATPSDTVAWRLDANGADWTVTITVHHDSAGRGSTDRHDTRYGYWHLQGILSDTSGRALCFKARPRDGADCYPFVFDTIRDSSSAAPRRRLVVLGYRGQRELRSRILLERLAN